MGNLFNSSEIVAMGIEKEKKRRDFYGAVAEHFQQKDMKNLFSKLRDWEEEHVKKFSQIRSSITDTTDEATESYSGEMQLYMQVLVDDKLYLQVSPEYFTRNVKTPLDAIAYGMQFEKDAILFFLGFLEHFRSSHKEVIQQLINEEKQHLVYLAQLRDSLPQ